MKLTSLVVAALLAAGSVEAQPRRDFSGGWVASREAPPDIPPSATPLFGQEFSIRHRGDTLMIRRTVRATTVTTSYTLDGREVRRRVPGGLCMADSEVVESAAWEGDRLVLTIAGAIPPGVSVPIKAGVKQTLRLTGPDTLIVEAQNRQSPARTTATVYKRPSQGVVEPDPPEARVTKAAIDQLSWLSGIWVGPTGSEERWTPAVSGSMMAVSRTLRNDVLTEFEFLCIVQRDGGLVYQAMPNGRSPATDFRMTQIDSNSVTFENPSHDFPKKIRYSLRPDGTLEAVVSGTPEDRALTFTFTRQKS
jgi:hypothetical protein